MPKGKDSSLAVGCPDCHALVNAKCVTVNGNERTTAHESRQKVAAATRRLNNQGLRGELPGQYAIKNLIEIERDSLDGDVEIDAVRRATVFGRPIVENYVVETIADADKVFRHVIECDGERWEIKPQVAKELVRQQLALAKAREADNEADRILSRYGITN